MSWVMIEGYKWPYRINEEAEIQKFYNGEWVNLKPYYHTNRIAVKLRGVDNKKLDTPLVWLMADAFMGGRRKGYNIIHKNGSKWDCSLNNLKFASKRESGLLSCNNRRRSVEKIDQDGNVLELYKSATEAAKKNFMAKNAVGQRCRNELKNPFKLTGFSFRYERTR